MGPTANGAGRKRKESNAASVRRYHHLPSGPGFLLAQARRAATSLAHVRTEPMRILHLLDIPWHSGLADYALRLANGQRHAGHEVWLAAGRGTGAATAAAALGIPVLPVHRWRDLPALQRFLRRLGIEVLNAHTGAAHTLAAAAIGVREPRQRKTGGPPQLVRTRADARPARRHPGAWILLGRTARYIGATEQIRRQFEEAMRIPRERTRTVYPATSLPESWSPPEWASAASERPGAAEEAVVTLLGRLDLVKGHAVFLEAAARIRNRIPATRFVAVGREEHVSIAELSARARRLGLGDAFRCTGHVDSIGPRLREATLGVVPSLGSEAVSRVALEWLAAARPIVASRVGGLPELVEDGRTGLLVPPGDPEALARAVIELLEDRPRLRAMAGEARRAAEARFSVERLVRETQEIYEEVLCRS